MPIRPFGPSRPMAGPTVLLLVAAVWLWSSSCSLVLDLQDCDIDDDCPDNQICSDDALCQSPTSQCADDEDCPEGEVCTDNICTDGSAQCTDNSDCIDLFDDDEASCHDGICEGDTDLTGGPCQELYGAVDADDPFLLGVVMQFSGVGGGFGRPMLDSIRIAKRDFNSIGGIDGRPVALLACDTEASDELAATGAEHLVETAGVDAIIGFNSSQLIDNRHLTDDDILLMSPSATAMTITGLADNDLIWRTAPSDETQALALSRLVEHTVEDVLPERGIEEAKVSILVRSGDQWSEGLRDVLAAELPSEIVDGQSQRFSIHSFPNIGEGQPADYSGTAAEVAAEDPLPDVVIVLGSADSWQLIDYIDSAIDSQPLFIGADAMKNTEEAAGASPELEGRIWGTGPRSFADLDYQPYTTFRLKFESEMNDDADNYQFVSNAFDAMYTLAFAAEAQGFSGPELAEGLRRLDDGDVIRPSAADASDALATLAAGGTINYQGASGPLNFNQHGDPEPMPIALWCFEDGTVPDRDEIYDPAEGLFSPASCGVEDTDSD